MSETIFTNARLVLADRVVERGTLVLDGARIVRAEEGASRSPAAVDLEGDLLIPGLVELHTDNLERHFAPRPGVRWPVENAVLGHDAQVAAAGITTVFDALSIGDIARDSVRRDGLGTMLDAVRHAEARGLTRAEHHLHLRCEVSYEAAADLFRGLAGTPMVRLVSIMDHTPGQRQFIDPDKLKLYYTKKYGMSDEQFAAFVAVRLESHHRYSAKHRAEIVALAREHGHALASHDDATEAHVEEAVANGMTIAEFPTTVAAARASHAAGLAVLVGAPNLVLGGSHSGNIAALDLVREGVVDILSSDYVPTSLLHSVFALATSGIGVDLPAAARMASRNPARAVGLEDRGELAPGQRADLVRVRLADDLPVPREVWRAGRRVA